MKLLVLTGLLATVMLTGCYTLYVDPATGPTAAITFEKDFLPKSSVATYINAEDCSGGRIIVSPILDRTPSMTKNFTSGKPVSLSFGADLGGSVSAQGMTFYGCNRTITFTPLEGEKYRASFSASSGQCELRIRKSDGTRLRPDEYRMRQWIRPFLDTGSFCQSPEQSR